MGFPADTAIVGGRLFTGLVELTDDIRALDTGGAWVVVLPFDGPAVCARFAQMEAAPADLPPAPWTPVPRPSWRSSVDRAGFAKAVRAIREAIAAGDVYQVNLCRQLSAALPAGADAMGLGSLLARAHPAPHAATVRLPSAGVNVASASPEGFLRRSGRTVESRPIKGTAATAGGFTGKDRAENVMIVDLVRNDLGRVCEFGSVEVTGLCGVEAHPGLYHLVSTVRGRLRDGVGWAELLDATFPPGSVTGAPKLAALNVIHRLEPRPRSVYCGAIGWVDADRGTGSLNVAIRTFWIEDGELHLGTGGGITWDSTPEGEWDETELKSARLLAVAASAG
ncbi:MAG: chorismate-binding protein [Acidimicrobiales bacterium]